MVFPVLVFVHGNGESASDWDLVSERFAEAGYEHRFAIDLQPAAHGDCVEYAGQIAAFITDEVLPVAETAPDAPLPIVLIAHSLGAASARYLLSSHALGERVDAAVYIAGAHNGAVACDMMHLADPHGQTFKQAAQLHTGGSDFLADLSRAGMPDGLREMTISGPHDPQFLMAEELAFIAGADNRVFCERGHWELRDHPDTFEAIRAFVERRACPLGLDAAPTPATPEGSWRSDRRVGPWFHFEADGSFQRLEHDSVHTGRYVIRPLEVAPPGQRSHTRAGQDEATVMAGHEIDLKLDDGTVITGRFRVSVNGDVLALALAEPGEDRPERMTLAPMFHRISNASIRESPADNVVGPPDRAAVEHLAGHWRFDQPGNLSSLGLSDGCLTLGADGEWSLRPGLSHDQDPVASGRWEVARHSHRTAASIPPLWNLDLWVTNSATPMLAVDTLWAGLVEPSPNAIRVEIAAHNHLTGRPQIIDRPTIMIRTTE